MLDLMGEWNKWLGRDVLKQENMHHLCEINDHLRVQMATTQEKQWTIWNEPGWKKFYVYPATLFL